MSWCVFLNIFYKMKDCDGALRGRYFNQVSDIEINRKVVLFWIRHGTL